MIYFSETVDVVAVAVVVVAIIIITSDSFLFVVFIAGPFVIASELMFLV